MSDADRCRHCGARRDQHGMEWNPVRPFACPASERFPKWPTTIRDDARAGQVFDKRVARHWGKRATSFASR